MNTNELTLDEIRFLISTIRGREYHLERYLEENELDYEDREMINEEFDKLVHLESKLVHAELQMDKGNRLEETIKRR